MGVLQASWVFVRSLLADRAPLLAENLALRQQLSVLQWTLSRQVGSSHPPMGS